MKSYNMENLLKKAKADVAAHNGYASWASIMNKVLFLEEVAQRYAELCLQEVRRRIDSAWSFDNNQWHTHNWHTKQDFLEWLDKYAGQPGDDGWISVTDVDRLPKNSDDWYIVARGKIVLVKGHCYLYGSWLSYGNSTATEGITHFRKFPEGAEKQ